MLVYHIFFATRIRIKRFLKWIRIRIRNTESYTIPMFIQLDHPGQNEMDPQHWLWKSL